MRLRAAPKRAVEWHAGRMSDLGIWPTTEAVVTGRLCLEPVSAEHAVGMVEVLGDPSIYAFTGGEAPSLDQLQRRYSAQSAGQSEDGSRGWFNWIVKRRDSDAPIGFVQATVARDGLDLVADIAWVVAPVHQGQGMASEAARAMTTWLRSNGVGGFRAYVHPGHRASMGVARNLGLRPTAEVEDGEVRWEYPRPGVDSLWPTIASPPEITLRSDP